jgi:hypothetical protein
VAFPSPSVAAPALNLYQWSFGGLTFGGVAAGSTYQLQSMTIDMPDVATGDVQRALEQGEFPGVDVLPGADITIVQTVTIPGLSHTAMPTLAQAIAIDQACQALGGVMGPGGVTEIPLWLSMASGTYVRMCRARKHNCPWDINRAFAGGAKATSLLHSTDPRWYAAPSVSQTAPLPAALGGGLPIAATIPAVLADGGIGALLTVVNAGQFESRPILIVTGPATNPVIANNSLPGAPFIGVNIALAPGDTLAIDLDWGSIVYTVAGTTLGSPRRDQLMAGTTWWNLPKQSSNQIALTTSDAAPVTGTLTVQSASAFLSL